MTQEQKEAVMAVCNESECCNSNDCRTCSMYKDKRWEDRAGSVDILGSIEILRKMLREET